MAYLGEDQPHGHLGHQPAHPPLVPEGPHEPPTPRRLPHARLDPRPLLRSDSTADVETAEGEPLESSDAGLGAVGGKEHVHRLGAELVRVLAVRRPRT